MPNIDLSILNQRQTPAFYADVFANRPAAGFIGRIFVSTNTFAFYRDNGTTWDLIGGPGTGTVTGTGANGQVTFWNGASTITGSNDLFWDATNGHFGVNTNVPGTALDVHHDQPTVAILNQTVATNDVRIGFQNNGVGLWRIGAFYNAGANDFGIYDAVAAIQPVTVKKTTGQVLIGTSTVGSGKLVVASSTGDNGVQIVGASAPSLRIDNAESGPTKRAGFGISTATNNFIQGSADRDFCMFNGSTTASPILFGIYDAGAVNVQEAARISAARNFLIGTTTDGGQKLQVSGSARATGYYLDGMTSGSGALYWTSNRVTLANYNAGGTLEFEVNGGSSAAVITSSGNFGIGTTAPLGKLDVYGGAANVESYIRTNSFDGTYYAALSFSTGGQGANDPQAQIRVVGENNYSAGIRFLTQQTGTVNPLVERMRLSSTGDMQFTSNPFIYSNTAPGGTAIHSGLRFDSTNKIIRFFTNDLGRVDISASGNLLIGTTTDAGQKLQVNGTALFSSTLTTNGIASLGITETTVLAYIGDRTTVNTRYIKFARGSALTDIVNIQSINGGVGADNLSLQAEGGNLLIGTSTSGASKLRIVGLPTSSAGLSSGDIWSNLGILTIVP